jgi:hypothetical protein
MKIFKKEFNISSNWMVSPMGTAVISVVIILISLALTPIISSFTSKYFKSENYILKEEISSKLDYYLRKEYPVLNNYKPEEIPNIVLDSISKKTEIHRFDLKDVLSGKNIEDQKIIVIVDQANKKLKNDLNDYLPFHKQIIPYHDIIVFFIILIAQVFIVIIYNTIKNQEYSLKGFPHSFQKYLKEITHSNKVHIQSIHNNYPHLLISSILNRVEPNDSGGVLVNLHCSEEEYSEIALNLLEETKESVFSTSYSHFFSDNLKLFVPDETEEKKMEIIKSFTEMFILPEKFTERSDHVKEWIHAVNNKIDKNNSFKSFRIQITRQKDKWFEFSHDSIKGSSQSEINTNKENAKNIYINSIIPYWQMHYLGIQNQELSAHNNFKSCIYIVPPAAPEKFKFWGEYIIFDNKGMLKYDFQFGLLEFYYGNIVNRFTESFNSYFSNNKDLNSNWTAEFNRQKNL